MLRCDDIERLLSDYEDGALPLGRRLAVKAHLLICAGCRSLERSLRQTLSSLHALRDEPLPDEESSRRL
jgi:anti-sigma factor RsiW